VEKSKKPTKASKKLSKSKEISVVLQELAAERKTIGKLNIKLLPQ